jgi:AraC-like DNA-binding protein
MRQRVYHQANSKDIEKVVGLLNAVYPVSEELRKEIFSHLVALDLKKGAILINEGETCQYMYFITKGALRAQTTHKGKKITTYISVENEFVSSISGMHGQRPTKEGIIAVEPTSLVALPNHILLGFFEKYFDFNYIFRVLVEKYYQDAQERSHIIRVGNARERYQYFLATKPGYIDRLPAEHIASLLDMKTPTLERIRKQHALSLKKDEDTERQCRQLEEYLHQDKRYSDKRISLFSLARALGLTPHKLSSLLNNSYQLSFADFINRLRINSIIEQLTLPHTIQHFTIEALAYNAGFTSRSAFYRAFRKQVGTSPAEYIQSIAK